MENGRPVYRNNYYRTLPQRYFAERECISARTEAMMRTLIAVMDHHKGEIKKANETIQPMEYTILALDDKRQKAYSDIKVLEEEKKKLETQVEKLEGRIKLMEDPLKMEAKLIESENWITILQGSIPQMGDTFTQVLDEKNSLKKENVDLKNEVEALKKKLEEATIEVEPAERFMMYTEGVYVPSEEWDDFVARRDAMRAKEAKRRIATPLACLDRIKRR
jgi:chromosome segregation ATPase